MTARFFGVTAAFSLAVGGAPFVWANTTGEGITIRWSVSMSRTELTSAKVEIVNASRVLTESLAAAYLAAPTGTSIATLALGWGFAGSPFFQPPLPVCVGTVLRMTPSRKSGVDTITTVEFGDSLQGIRDAPPGIDLGAAVGITWSTAVVGLGVPMGYLVSPDTIAAIDAAASAKGLPTCPAQSLSFSTKNPRDLLDQIMNSLGLSWRCDLNQLKVVDLTGLRNDLPLLPLAPQTGLIEWSAMDDGGTSLTAYAYPTTRPGQQITAVDELGVPVSAQPARVDSIEFSGSTMTESLMRIEARKLALV